MSKSYQADNFVYSYRRFANPNYNKKYNPSATEDLHLNYKEFYLYATLHTKKMKDESIIVNISLIEQLLLIPYDQRETRNRKLIKDTLLELISKKIYIVHNDVNLKQVDNNTLFELTINEELLKSTIDGDEWRGFVSIPYKELSKFKSMKLLYIYFATFANETVEGQARVPYETWADILQVSYKTAVKHVNESVVESDENGGGKDDTGNTGVIYVKRGEYLSSTEKRRDVNTYSTEPFYEDEKAVIKKVSKKLKHKKNNLNGFRSKSNKEDENPF